MPYGVIATYPVSQGQIFGVVGERHARGLSIIPDPFLCCGVTSITNFGQTMLRDFASKAAFLAGLWATNRGRTHFMYILTHSGSLLRDHEHGALMEVGSTQVCEFHNLNHSPHNLLKVFVVDLNAGIGKFFDANGVPFTAPPAVAAPERAPTVVVTAPIKKDVA